MSYNDGSYDDYGFGRSMFANPGGRSTLRRGRRCHPCPTCKEPNKLSAADVRRGYQCDDCADRAEGIG